MNIQDESLDKLFREKTENINKVPLAIKWNKEKGWESYSKKYNNVLFSNRLYLLAASIALLIVAGTVLLYIKNNRPGEIYTFEGNENLVKEITLKGGHLCFLAPDSKIQYQNTRNTDTVYLQGEGYFETSSTRPLVIIAKNTITKCENSKLNVKAVKTSQTTVINSLEGKITSCCNETDFPEMVIEPNERCIIYEGGIYAAKEPNTDPNFLSWKTGILTFNNIPLAHAIKTLEELYNVNIEVQSDDMKYCRLSSDFENSTFESVLEYIQCHYDALVTRSRSSIVLEGGICKN